MRFFADAPVAKDVVNRVSELTFLEENLVSHNTPVLVTGVAGTGKTTLLRMFAHQFKDHYQGVCFLSLYSYLGEDLFALLASQIGATSTSQYEVGYLLSERKHLILADELDAVPPTAEQRVLQQARTLIDLRGNSSLLFSSRNTDLLRVATPHELAHLSLSGLSFDDMRSLAEFYGLEVTDAALYTVYQRVSGHPLALRLLFSSIQAGAYSEAQLLAQLEDTFQEEWGSRLTNLLVAHTPEGLRAYPVSSVGGITVITSTAQTLASAPYIVVPNIRHFWQQQLEEFEELLNDVSARESDFQRFFESHPHFLVGLDYKNAIPHPILQRDEKGPLIPDFFLQPLESRFCDVLDLKLPSAKLIVGSKNRKRFGHSVQDAIAQLREYHDYFENPVYRQRVESRYGLTAYRPTLVVIIGRTPESVDEVKLRQMTSQHPGFQIITYDQLHRRMRRLLEVGSF